ncbi:MAG: hypothetical protein J7L79_02270 [Thaumarchaeota archaeon]|nr:hypothetical protein [Nitrososphaerota archaeon]
MEAAKLLYHGSCKEYIEAKRIAAQSMGYKVMPSNLEVAIKLLEYALLMEGDEYWERLRKLRKEALRLMTVLSEFRPKLVGSVWIGIIKPTSDIDIELDFTDPDPVRQKLLKENYKIIEDTAVDVPEPLRCGSLWRIKIKMSPGLAAEIVLKEHEWYVNPSKCDIYGDVRKGLNLMELRNVLETEPDKLFVPEEA